MAKFLKRTTNKHKKRQFKKTQALLLFLNIVMTAIIGYFWVWSNVWILPIGWLIGTCCIIGLICIGLVKWYFNWRKTTVMVQLLYCTMTGFILFNGFKTYQTVKTMQNNFTQLQYKFKVMTLESSSVFTIPQVNAAILVPEQIDGEYIQKLVKDIADNTNVTVKIAEVDSYLQAYQKLLTKEVPAIVMNSAEEPLIYRQYPMYYQSVKSIYEYTTTTSETVQLEQSQTETNLLFGIATNIWHIQANTTLSSAMLYKIKQQPVAKNVIDLSAQKSVTQANKTVTVSVGGLGLFGKDKLLQAISEQENVTIHHAVLVDFEKNCTTS